MTIYIGRHISTVKTAVGQKKKTLKLALESSLSTGSQATKKPVLSSDATTVASQNSIILQLMEQVLQIKLLENKQMLNHFVWLATQMEAFMSGTTTTITRCHAGGHRSEYSPQT